LERALAMSSRAMLGLRVVEVELAPRNGVEDVSRPVEN
jgi:hypothetical protein